MPIISGTSLLKWLKARTWAYVVLLSVLVGVVAGFGAIVFSKIQQNIDAVVMIRGAGYVMPRPGAEGDASRHILPARRWVLLLAPAVGGLLAGLLIYSLAPEAEGHGTDSVVDAFHRRRGAIRGRVPIVKLIASALTIGSGGSAGREGPIGQIGAGFGSALAAWLKAGDRDRRRLMLAGAAAGIGAIFRAPLGGALFIVEVLYRDAEFESAALVPAFVASIVAYSIYCGITGVWGPMFRVPNLQFLHPMELPLYVLLGVACAIVGSLYVKVFYGMRDYVFRPMPIPNHFKPAIGGLALGGIALIFPEVLGMGYGWAQMAIDGTLPLRIAILLPLLKILGTAFTIGSGGSGGVFAPSMVIGGLLGSAMGSLFHHLMPGIVPQPATFVLVGMAGFFAGAAKVPLSSLVMVSEMTTGYGLLVPLMLTNAVAFLLTPRSVSIYEQQVNARVDSGAHEGEFFYDVLERIRVQDALTRQDPPLAIRRNTPLTEILQALSNTRQQAFPVFSEDGSLYGVIDVHDIRGALANPTSIPGLVIADDLCSRGSPQVQPDESLASALRKFRGTTLEELPVVRCDDSREVVGMLSRKDITHAYHDYLYRGRNA